MNPLKNMIIWLKFNDEGVIDKLINLTYIDSELSFEVGMARWSEKSEHRKENVYIFKREMVKLPPFMFNGQEIEAIVQYYHGVRNVAMAPWFVRMEEL